MSVPAEDDLGACGGALEADASYRVEQPDRPRCIRSTARSLNLSIFEVRRTRVNCSMSDTHTAIVFRLTYQSRCPGAFSRPAIGARGFITRAPGLMSKIAFPSVNNDAVVVAGRRNE